MGIESQLKASGLKATAARVRVLEVLGQHEHLSPEQVHFLAQRNLPGMSLSTTYRTLDTLCQAGLASYSHLHETARSYHLAEHGGHAHLACHRCGQAVIVDAAEIEGVADQLAHDHGFHLDLDHVVLTGVCAVCEQAQARVVS